MPEQNCIGDHKDNCPYPECDCVERLLAADQAYKETKATETLNQLQQKLERTRNLLSGIIK